MSCIKKVHEQPCSICNGTGQVQSELTETKTSWYEKVGFVEHTFSTGRYVTITCTSCHGKGYRDYIQNNHDYQYVKTIKKSTGGGLFGLGAIEWFAEVYRCVHCGDSYEKDVGN